MCIYTYTMYMYISVRNILRIHKMYNVYVYDFTLHNSIHVASYDANKQISTTLAKSSRSDRPGFLLDFKFLQQRLRQIGRARRLQVAFLRLRHLSRFARPQTEHCS